MEREKGLLREELICALCLDILRQPRVLSCAHTFCQECLQRFLEGLPCSQENAGSGGEGESRWEREEAVYNGTEGGRQLEKDSDTSSSEREKEIECPSCGAVTQLPRKGVWELPKHTRLESLVHIVSEEEKLRTRKRLRQTVTKSRNITAEELPRCTVHGDVKEYLCNQCTEFLCMQCIMEDHQFHDYKDATQILPSRIAALHNQIQPAHAFVEKAANMVDQLSQDYDAILANQKRCKENVAEAFARIHSALEEREKALQLTIDRYAQAKINVVTDHRHKLTKGKEKVLCCIESISRLLERAGDISVLCEDQALLEELDIQEQLILEVDGDAATAMHSSSYVGFREDHVPVILKEAPKAVTLCEFYPEGDSGYYASRKIVVDDCLEEEEDNAYDVVRHGGALRYTRTIHHEPRPNVVVRRKKPPGVVVKIGPDHSTTESPTTTESPSVSRRSSASVSSGVFDELLLPNAPVRHSSLFSLLPIQEPLKVFDKLGGSRKESVHPCGLCIIANDSIIVSDIKNHCLRMIASNGKFIDRIGSEGKGSGLFEEPCGMCLNSKGNIMVTQRQNPRIQTFTPSGKFVFKFGQKSLRGSNLSEPWAVCTGDNGKIYVSDWDKSCIHIFQDSGRYLCTLGRKKNDVGIKASLLFPGGITCDSHGRILVTDRGNHCVWLLQPDGSILTRFGSKGHAPGELYYPYGIAVTTDGRIVVSESGNHRISIFSPSGQFEYCFGHHGGQPGFFDHPRHIALTSRGELVVVDEINERLQVFSLS